MGNSFSFDKANPIAEMLIQSLNGSCREIKIAGSIRRKSQYVKDIELVASPVPYLDLFGGEGLDDELLPLVSKMIEGDRLALRNKDGSIDVRSQVVQARSLKWGRKYIALVHKRSTIPVDLFIVRQPSNFSWQMIIRTGPKEFSKAMMIRAKQHGFEAHDGALWVPGREYPENFQSEEEIFKTLEMDYIEPNLRK